MYGIAPHFTGGRNTQSKTIKLSLNDGIVPGLWNSLLDRQTTDCHVCRLQHTCWNVRWIGHERWGRTRCKKVAEGQGRKRQCQQRNSPAKLILNESNLVKLKRKPHSIKIIEISHKILQVVAFQRFSDNNWMRNLIKSWMGVSQSNEDVLLSSQLFNYKLRWRLTVRLILSIIKAKK